MPRVTTRFDEFVSFTDAAGFGHGQRTRPYVDWPRIIAWSAVALPVIAMLTTGVIVYSAAR